MHAFLVSGGTKEKRLAEIEAKQKEWRVSSFDRIALEPTEGTIGIAAIREFQKQLIMAPYNSPTKVGVITDAEMLTVEAQNALLKTLEEPPPRTHLVLEAPSSDVLLPTIVSRCHIVHLNEPDAQLVDVTSVMRVIDQIIEAPVARRIELIDEFFKTRDEAKQWVGEAILAMRETLYAQNGLSRFTSHVSRITPARILRSLLTAQAQLTANVTPKLVLDNLFLSL